MKQFFKKALIGLAFFFFLIQFYPMEKPVQQKKNPNDFIATNKVPENIAVILKTSCYDCHSNTNNFPWYAKIAPVKWLVYHDINEGREALNFSEWNTLSEDDKSDKLFDIQDVVSEGEMPMKIYTIMHSKAKLSKKQQTLISNFIEEFAE